jgi:hypothetical protein
MGNELRCISADCITSMWKKYHGIRNYKENNNSLVGEGGRSFLSREIYSPDFWAYTSFKPETLAFVDVNECVEMGEQQFSE